MRPFSVRNFILTGIQFSMITELWVFEAQLRYACAHACRNRHIHAVVKVMSSA